MIKIGHSFDIHRLEKDRKLILGGITIPHDKGLLGHSDADALLHVVAESIIGALGKGDLGTFFPDNDEAYKNKESKYFVLEAVKMMEEEGYHINNIDATIFAEKPKMAPYISDIKKSIAALLNIDARNVNVKATCFEKLDAIGKEEAIASEAVVLIEK